MARKTYSLLWRNKHLTTEAKTIGEMAAALEDATKQLREMEAAGVELDVESGIEDDYAELKTGDRAIAQRFAME